MKTLRLGLLASCLLSSCLFLAACGGSTAPDTTAPVATPAPAAPKAEDKTLHVYNWSDYVAEDTIAKFTAQTGINVVYDVYDANEILEAKLMTGGSGYDVVFPSARPFAQRQVAANVYAPLDRSKLPNWKNLDATLLARMPRLRATACAGAWRKPTLRPPGAQPRRTR